MNERATNPGSRMTATQRVLASVRRRIIHAELPPGALLLEPELAAEYGVSKTPTREALQILATEGLVTVIPRRGYYVSHVSFQDFRDAMDLRLLLEPPLTALAAQRRTQQQLDEWHRLLSAQFDPRAPLADRLEAATSFHRACVAASGNALANTVVDSLFTAIQRLHHLDQTVESRFESSGERIAHEGILRAIADRDSELAHRLMHAHLAEANDAIARTFLVARPEHA